MKGEKPHSDRRASAKYRFSHGPRATGSERCSAYDTGHACTVS